MTLGDVLHNVLVRHDVVRHLDERVVAHVNLALARGCHLVMVLLDDDAVPAHDAHAFAAEVLERVHGGRGK